MVGVVLIIKIVGRIRIVGEQKVDARSGERSERAGAGITAGGAIHLAAGSGEVGCIGIQPDHTGEAGENGFIGKPVLSLDVSAIAGLVVVGLVAVRLQVVNVYLQVELVIGQDIAGVILAIVEIGIE